jgi:hypothetical protein
MPAPAQRTQASRNTSCRVGRVLLTDTPSFTPKALALLRSPDGDGESRFREQYGDFFVAGYVLGGDAGACLSLDEYSRNEAERTEITVTVKVLFSEASDSKKEEKVHVKSSAAMAFAGYNSFTGESQALNFASTQEREHKQLQAAAAKFIGQVAWLEREVRKRLNGLGVKDGAKMPLSEGLTLCQTGVVVQLLMFPFARLQQFVQTVPRIQMAGWRGS